MGERVGRAEGAALGEVDGAPEGDADGSAVGRAEGETVGDAVGTCVLSQQLKNVAPSAAGQQRLPGSVNPTATHRACTVQSASVVGLALGAPLGDADGACVGANDGDVLGDADG